MLKLVFLAIILYIIIQHCMEQTEEPKNKPVPTPENQVIEINNGIPKDRAGVTGINGLTIKEKFSDTLGEITEQSNNKPRVVDFDKPNPWTKVVIVPLEEYPYFFHVKVKIPSLNDFENWKQIIPNINFDPRTGELIIPSKDEASALALCNLIVINFLGQLSLQNILEKNLIQISVAKAKNYEMVQNKLREQINENLYGRQNNTVQTNYHRDLARDSVENFAPSSNSGRVDFKSETFVDTFENFSDNVKQSSGIEAWDGSDYSYL